MAELTRVNGDAGTVGATVVNTGAQIDFYKVMVDDTGAVDLRTEMGALGLVEAVLRAAGQNGNIEMYKVEDDASGQISLGMATTGTWTAATLEDAVQAVAGATTSTVTAPGLTLA